jgi:DNA-binding LacI/PurR family transcriptional regulator
MTIGLILPFERAISNLSFCLEIMMGAEEKAFEKDYMLLTGNSHNNEKEHSLASKMCNRDVEGLIILSTSGQNDGNHLKFLETSEIPLVLVDQKVEGISANIVRGDNFKGSYNVMNYLFSLGHRDIAMISRDKHSTFIDRIKGYQMAMMEQGLTIPERYLIAMGLNQDVESELKSLLTSKPRPTALFIADPLLLLKFLHLNHELNLRIPEDINIVVFDDIYAPLPEEYKNFFTSVNQSAKLLGSMAVEVLFQQIKNPDLENQEIVLTGKLNKRKSTCSIG